MNWVGGVRSRLNKKNEKRIQQQFFEEKRKKKLKDNDANNSTAFQSTTWHLSQDILSFKRLSNVHSEKSDLVERAPKKARFVDLDATNSKARFIRIKDCNNSFDKNLKASVLELSDSLSEEKEEEITQIERKADMIKSIVKRTQLKSNSVEMLSESVLDSQDTVTRTSFKSKKSKENIVKELNEYSDESDETTDINEEILIVKENSNRKSLLTEKLENEASERMVQDIKKSTAFFNLFEN